MRHSTLIVATVFTALTVFAAAPSKPLPEPIVIKLADIYTEFVHIRPLDDSNGAHLTFLFARKSKRAVDAISLRCGKRPVHVADGQKLIAEAKVAGLAEWRSYKNEKRYGLILAFDSVEEADRVARAIRPLQK